MKVVNVVNGSETYKANVAIEQSDFTSFSDDPEDLNVNAYRLPKLSTVSGEYKFTSAWLGGSNNWSDLWNKYGEKSFDFPYTVTEDKIIIEDTCTERISIKYENKDAYLILDVACTINFTLSVDKNKVIEDITNASDLNSLKYNLVNKFTVKDVSINNIVPETVKSVPAEIEKSITVDSIQEFFNEVAKTNDMFYLTISNWEIDSNASSKEIRFE